MNLPRPQFSRVDLPLLLALLSIFIYFFIVLSIILAPIIIFYDGFIGINSFYGLKFGTKYQFSTIFLIATGVPGLFALYFNHIRWQKPVLSLQSLIKDPYDLTDYHDYESFISKESKPLIRAGYFLLGIALLLGALRFSRTFMPLFLAMIIIGTLIAASVYFLKFRLIKLSYNWMQSKNWQEASRENATLFNLCLKKLSESKDLIWGILLATALFSGLMEYINNLPN